MKHMLVTSLLCSLSSIVFATENPWQAYKIFQHDDNLRSAYFNAEGTSIITCTGTTERVIDIQSGRNDDQQKNDANIIVSLNPTEKFFVLNRVYSARTNVIYWPYKGRINNSCEFNSSLSVTPHRCTLQKYGEKRELAGIADGSDKIGYWLRLYDVTEGKVFLDYYHPYKVIDFCLHPNKNIVASITSSPDPEVRIWNTEKWHRFPTKSYSQNLYSIRFDETGDRLVVAGNTTIEILDVTNPQELKTITSFVNTYDSRQACLSGQWLAVTRQSFITLFDIQTKKEIASLRGNNNSSPMDCFSPAGNFLVVLDGKHVIIYKKTEAEKTLPLTSHKETANVAKSDDSSDESPDECRCFLCNNQIIKTLSSVCVFLQNNFCG